MKIEVWSDAVCPWCYIGLKRLQAALALRPAVAAQIRWMPFELNPDMPAEGMDRRQYLQIKFGDPDPFKGSRERLQSLTSALGIDYQPEVQGRMPNTRHAHMLIAAAAATGRQTELVEAIFRAYFSEGRDIGETMVLRELAAPVGFDGASVAAVLDDASLRAAVQEHEDQARHFGITGVPTFVFERQVGFSGAQEVAVFLRALDHVAGVANVAASEAQPGA